MLRVGHYLFKRAESKQEFEQVHRLNHRTFVDEIPQHQPTGTGALVDKFHHKNVYLIVLRDDRVVGMVSTHDQPPFSVADRLPDPKILDQDGSRPLEVRLLAIEPRERNNTLFFGLIWTLYAYAQKNGYTHLFISGVEKRQKLYERLGFVPLGPAVRCGEAAFVPMVQIVGQLPGKLEHMKKMWEMRLEKGISKSPTQPVCLLPGPVTMSREVQASFSEPPIYHRGPEFIDRFVKVRGLLGDMVGGRDVAILNGSGTLANETIAATLAAGTHRGRGVMLINGEFGERIARQATRFGLEPHTLAWAWGEPWDLDEIDEALSHEPAGSWVWGVHQESSTGVLNDLAGLVAVSRKRGVHVCVDCISSLGAVPIDLGEVFLASGATGKSLGSYAGASLIFADREALSTLDRKAVPSYFDLVAALSSEGPCYTFPSPTLAALETALRAYDTPEKARTTYARYHGLGAKVRQELGRLGLTPLAAPACASPVVTTLSPPGEEPSDVFVKRCRSWGYAIGGESAYLSRRRLVQIATMGAVEWDMLAGIFDHLESWLAKRVLAGV
ncbi:MAG TPA: GNAT family N-acetyltransferase [Gemmataceae bacterium]|nr:GNAT family N-acetyltransferase [Gemmataceae bacterium]